MSLANYVRNKSSITAILKKTFSKGYYCIGFNKMKKQFKDYKQLTWPIGPIFKMFWNCSYISLRVKLPSDSFCRSSGC